MVGKLLAAWSFFPALADALALSQMSTLSLKVALTQYYLLRRPDSCFICRRDMRKGAELSWFLHFGSCCAGSQVFLLTNIFLFFVSFLYYIILFLLLLLLTFFVYFSSCCFSLGLFGVFLLSDVLSLCFLVAVLCEVVLVVLFSLYCFLLLVSLCLCWLLFVFVILWFFAVPWQHELVTILASPFTFCEA